MAIMILSCLHDPEKSVFCYLMSVICLFQPHVRVYFQASLRTSNFIELHRQYSPVSKSCKEVVAFRITIRGHHCNVLRVIKNGSRAWSYSSKKRPDVFMGIDRLEGGVVDESTGCVHEKRIRPRQRRRGSKMGGVGEAPDLWPDAKGNPEDCAWQRKGCVRRGATFQTRHAGTKDSNRKHSRNCGRRQWDVSSPASRSYWQVRDSIQ